MSASKTEQLAAVISEDRLYRYSLHRWLHNHPDFKEPDAWADRQVLFIGVNPSTADAFDDDATIRKMSGFAARWGFRRMAVGNLFAYRSTDVRGLGRHYLAAHVTPDDRFNQRETELRELRRLIRSASLIVPCWGGTKTKLPPALQDRALDVLYLLRNSGKPLRHLGMTKHNEPKHPLMLPYSTELDAF